MKYSSLFLSLLICINYSMITIYADVIANPLIWLIADPVFLVVLIAGVIVLTQLLKLVKKNHRGDEE